VFGKDKLGGLAGVLLVAVLGLLAACGGAQHATDIPDPIEDTTLGTGDVFDVNVYDEEQLSGSYQIADDGFIDFPLVGRVEVTGLEPPAVAALLTERLRDGEFLVSPHVSVFVQAYNSKRFAVVGAVQRAGNFPFVVGMTVVQALGEAGGFTPLASRNDVTLSRRVNGELRRFNIRVGDIASGEVDDPGVQAGDIIFVAERVF